MTGIRYVALAVVLLAAALLFPMVYLLFKTKPRGYYCNLLIVQGAMIGAVAAIIT